MQSRPPQIREDFSEVQALKRCIRRRNSQVALILAVVLISLSACLMPQTSRDRFVGNNGSIQKNEYGQQKTSEWLFRESTLDAPFSFRSRLGRRYQGGGLMGKPVIDTHRGDSVFRRDRAGKVLAYRGGAAGDAAGANSSNARTSGRGRGWKATPYAKGGGAASEVPSTMKALVIEDYSMDLSKIALKTVEVPKPKGDEVLVKVLAAAINPIDRAVMRGFLKDSYIIPKFPSLTGFDMAAVVIETGVDEKRLKVGDTVWAALPTPKRGEPLIMGAFAEYAVLPGSKCGVSPSNLSPVEIAALPVAVLTSGQALEQCRLEKGQRLLVLGGSSSTGSAAIQLAKAKGFHVTTTCSSRNIEYVKSLDADRVIDYTKTHWPDVVEDLDAVYDCVGEKGVCSHANKVLRKGGRFVSIAAFEEFWDHRWNKDVAAQILTMDPTKRACLDAARDLVEAGKLKVRIAKVHPLEKIAAAVREEGGSAAGGKVVINMM